MIAPVSCVPWGDGITAYEAIDSKGQWTARLSPEDAQKVRQKRLRILGRLNAASDGGLFLWADELWLCWLRGIRPVSLMQAKLVGGQESRLILEDGEGEALFGPEGPLSEEDMRAGWPSMTEADRSAWAIRKRWAQDVLTGGEYPSRRHRMWAANYAFRCLALA